MALFELSVLLKEVICYYHHFPQSSSRAETGIIKIHIRYRMSPFMQKLQKQTRSSVLRIKTTTEQGPNAFDIQGVTIRELTVVLCSSIKKSRYLLQQYYCCSNTIWDSTLGFPCRTKEVVDQAGGQTITKCDHEAMKQFS